MNSSQTQQASVYMQNDTATLLANLAEAYGNFKCGPSADTRDRVLEARDQLATLGLPQSAKSSSEEPCLHVAAGLRTVEATSPLREKTNTPIKNLQQTDKPTNSPIPRGCRMLHKQLRSKHRTDAQLFFASDANRDNKLNLAEFSKGIKMMGVRPAPFAEELEGLFKAFDTDGDGWIQWEEMHAMFGTTAR